MNNKSKSFEQDYINYYLKKVEYIENKYPNITEKGRRTGRALKNICFFIWSYTKDENDETINLLLKASVLLSAQDDFYDNIIVDNKQKLEFYSACENVITGEKYQAIRQSQQFIELINLWKEIVKEVSCAPEHLYLYWQRKAMELNTAMIIENSILRKNNIAFNDYMETSINSFGIMFIWATYFTKKNTSNIILKKIDPILFIGAKVARLSNDIASHRTEKNKMNAVNIVKHKKSAKIYILNLIKKEQDKFNKRLLRVKIEEEIKQAIKKSVDFLVAFYKTS